MVKMSVGMETRSRDDTIIFFFTLPPKAQEQLTSAAILAMDDPITDFF
jgi:hypothetical protein